MLLEKNKTQIKIIDFGISRKLRPNEPTKETFGTPEFVGEWRFDQHHSFSYFSSSSSGSNRLRTSYLSHGYVEYWCDYLHLVRE